MDKKSLIALCVLFLCSSAAAAQPAPEAGVAVSSASGKSWHPVPALVLPPQLFAAPASTAPKADLREVVSRVYPAAPGQAIKTIGLYKGDADVKTQYKMDLPKGAHWRVLWKIECSDKKEKGLIKLEIRSPSDPSYLQGITKSLLPVEESSFGVINICLLTGGEFTIDLTVSYAKWSIEVQQI